MAVRTFRYFLDISVAGWRRAVAVAAVALGVAGCATAPSGGAPGGGATEAERVVVVTKRAEERWALLLKGDAKAAYAYLSPASRQIVSQERFEARTKTGNLREVKVDKVTCEGEICRARFFLTYDHRLMQGVVTPMEETWVFEGGQAWYVFRE